MANGVFRPVRFSWLFVFDFLIFRKGNMENTRNLIFLWRKKVESVRKWCCFGEVYHADVFPKYYMQEKLQNIFHFSKAFLHKASIRSVFTFGAFGSFWTNHVGHRLYILYSKLHPLILFLIGGLVPSSWRRCTTGKSNVFHIRSRVFLSIFQLESHDGWTADFHATCVNTKILKNSGSGRKPKLEKKSKILFKKTRKCI